LEKRVYAECSEKTSIPAMENTLKQALKGMGLGNFRQSETQLERRGECGSGAAECARRYQTFTEYKDKDVPKIDGKSG